MVIDTTMGPGPITKLVMWLTQKKPGIDPKIFPNVCIYTDYSSLSARLSYLFKSINVLQ